MSLRVRWALTVGTVAAVAIAVTTVIALASFRAQLVRQVDESLLLRAQVARGGAGLPEPFRGPAGGPIRTRIVSFDAVVQGIDSGGEVVAFIEGNPRLPVTGTDIAIARRTAPAAIRGVEVEGVDYRMITVDLPRRRGPAAAGVDAIQIAIDVTDISQAVRALVSRLTVVGAVAVGLAASIGYLLALNAVRPIERLTAWAEQVAATEDLDTRPDTRAPAEVGRLATAFGSMLASLRRSREQQRRLVADAGHELRTPLTALRTNLETLHRRGPELDPVQRRELLDAALAEIEELSLLTEELVDLSSDEADRVDTMVPVDLADLAGLVAGRYRRRTGREIVVVAIDQDHEVAGHPARLDRALANLVDNAVKWSPEGSPIEVGVAGTRVEVRDHGPGIPEEDLPHIWGRFYRSAEGRSKPGSGLGLAIVQHVVQGHGGTVFAHNAPGGGAVVGFELPPADVKSPAG